VFHLALEEIVTQHTGENLKKLILSSLERYGIFPKHLYSVTSDNGTNMLKMMELLNDDY